MTQTRISQTLLLVVALLLGATFVARSFSGDKKQLVPILKSAIAHKGFAIVDVISPCVSFNDHEGSTKSYDYVRQHNEAVSRIDFITTRDEITATYAPGEVINVHQHDGSMLRLRKLHDAHDPTDRLAALNVNQAMQARGEGRVLDQFANPDNPRAHYETTGPEIWKQTDGKVTHWVAGVGTGGTITGIGRRLREANPAVRIAAIVPESAARFVHDPSAGPGTHDRIRIDHVPDRLPRPRDLTPALRTRMPFQVTSAG